MIYLINFIKNVCYSLKKKSINENMTVKYKEFRKLKISRYRNYNRRTTMQEKHVGHRQRC